MLVKKNSRQLCVKVRWSLEARYSVNLVTAFREILAWISYHHQFYSPLRIIGYYMESQIGI